MTHQSQIQIVLKIPPVMIVCGVSYPLKLFRKKGSIFGVAFQRIISWVPNGLTWIWFIPPGYSFCLTKSVSGTLSQLSLTLSSLEILCKNRPPYIMIIDEANKRWVKNPSGGLFTFFQINMYGLEYFRCVYHEILGRIFVSLLPYGWDFTGLRSMVRHPCGC